MLQFTVCPVARVSNSYRRSRMSSLICHCTPLPPARNGIADYAYRVAGRLAIDYDSVILCDDPFALAPAGVPVMDPKQAFRLPRARTCFVHQLGNNFDHGFVLHAALTNPGIVVLHDLKLLYLHESLGLAEGEMLSAMARSNPYVARARAVPFVLEGRKRPLDYSLFDMLADVVGTAKAVVVHTAFAKHVLLRHFGGSLSRKVYVIPHFAIEADPEPREQARARLSLDDDCFVVVTAGFATRAKRYDLIVPALERVATLQKKVIWVQAGNTRPDEYDLERLVAGHPSVQRIARFTGYLSERDLDGYVAAADVLVNLRFPSYGESSGALARALAAGTPCIVSDTAGYRELPDDVVIKVPPSGGAEPLAVALLGLLEQPAARDAYSRNARDFARKALDLETYIARFRHVIDEVLAMSSTDDDVVVSQGRREVTVTVTYDRERRPVIPILPVGTPVTLRVGPISPADLGFGAAERQTPGGMYVASADIEVDRTGAEPNHVFLNLRGHYLG